LIDYISAQTYTNTITDLTVADLVVSGPWFDIASTGRTINLAYGAQFRNEGFQTLRDDISTQQLDPQTGILQDVDLIFLGGGYRALGIERLFRCLCRSEHPISDSIEMSVAARYESLESDNSLDPKLALRWQVTDELVVRGSMSTAFREASLVQQFNRGTSLQGLVDPLGGGGALFIRVLTEGDTGLKPETSTNTNLGVV
jgi:iron complex outermembrane receptor protein